MFHKKICLEKKIDNKSNKNNKYNKNTKNNIVLPKIINENNNI